MISGPSLMLCANGAQTLAMALHELATNAAKYGALSTPSGRVAVEWSWDTDGNLVLHWTETGGPPIRMPKIGRASCRERGGQYGEIQVWAGPVQKKLNVKQNV